MLILSQSPTSRKASAPVSRNARAVYLLKWLAALDAIEKLRLDAEDVLGLDDAQDVTLELERIEYALRNAQPRLRG